jgi:ABC-2 type transport system permease protein
LPIFSGNKRLNDFAQLVVEMFQNIIKLTRYFFLYSKLKLARGMQYRSDFIWGFLISLCSSSLSAFFVYLIFAHVKGYPRWNAKQIILFQGVILLWLGIKDLLFGEVRPYIERMVKEGEFDRLLTKPYSPIGIILCSGFSFQNMGSILAGFIVIHSALKQLGLSINPAQLLLFVGFLICGIVLYMAITVIYSLVTIMVVYMGRLGEVIDKLLQFSQYPIELFPQGIRMIFMIIFPVSVWICFPAEILLNRLDLKLSVSMLVCLVIFFFSIKLWEICLKRYTSAGG